MQLHYFFMIPHKKNSQQIGFFSSFEDTLNIKHPLFILANKIDWALFENAFLPLYSQNNGAKTIITNIFVEKTALCRIFLVKQQN